MMLTKRILIFITTGLFLTSCGHKEHILKNKDFDELRLIEHYATENIWLTTDTNVINELKSKVYYIDNENCHWTTPDHAIQFLLKGKIIETYGYCHGYQTNLDNLKNKLHKTTVHEVEFKSKQEWQEKLKLLYADKFTKVDYTSPDSINIFGVGVFNINITDTTKEDEEKHTIKLFNSIKNLYKLNDNTFSVKAWQFSPNGNIDYTVAIRCDTSWSVNFDESKLRSTDITSKFEIQGFKSDEYKIGYRNWSNQIN